MKYKALICDVDGTLIPNRQDGVPSQNVVKAIEKAQKKVHVGIATARSLSSLTSIFNRLPLYGPSIITGGAQIIDPKLGKIFSQRLLSVTALEEVKKIAKVFEVKLIVADYGEEKILSDSYIPYEPLDIYTEPIPLQRAHKFMQQISHISSIAVHIASAWGEDGNVHVTVTNPEATKLHGIIEVSKILKIKKEEIIGVGEGYNDFPLLMACGLKIAMGNAVQDVKAIADYIAPTVEQDGVMHIIEKFIL